VVDGTTITRVDITADLSALQSDESRRDGQLRRQALETDTFPTATFSLTQPIELGAVPSEGQAIAVTAIGDLTLHGVTRSVQLPLSAVLSGGVVTVTGSIEIVFADYSITPPSSFVVLSVADHGTMELQLAFRRG
jgi:polyisoprenoid-binding protein YceI